MALTCLFSIHLPRGASPGSLPGKHTCGSEGPGGPRKAQPLPHLRSLVSVPCPPSWLTPIIPLVRLLQGLRCSPTARTQPPSPLQVSTRACYVGPSGGWRTTRIKYTQPWLATHQGPDLPLASRLQVGQELYSKLSMNTTPLIPFFKSDYHDDLGCQVCTLSWLINKSKL